MALLQQEVSEQALTGLGSHSLAEGVRGAVLSLSRHPDGQTAQILTTNLQADCSTLCSESTECLAYVFCSVGYDYQSIYFIALNSPLSKMN